VDEEYGLEGVTFGERDDPGPLRRLFMTDGELSLGVWLCFLLFMALDSLVVIFYAGDLLNGEESFWSYLTTPGVVVLTIISLLILVLGFYVQDWAND